MSTDYQKGKNDVKDLKEGTESTWEKTKNMAIDAKDYVVESAESAWEKTKEVAQNAYDKTIGAFESKPEKSTTESISDRAEGAKDQINEYARDAKNNLADKADKTLEKTKEVVENVRKNVK
jgi:ElaB/YqjD/DUF883 family membrane-anchored ribosome-binding protein